MSAPSIPRVKAAIRQLNWERARQIARTVVALESADAVQAYLESYSESQLHPQPNAGTAEALSC